jgi:uncharacterized phage-associated protein
MNALDPRSVANTIIRFASEYKKPLTDLSLQKIVYFTHARYLIEEGSPLVSGYFEAWKYGPVHPVLYNAFKGFGSNNISSPATSRNLMSGEVTVVPEPDVLDTILFIRESAAKYVRTTPGRLVDLAHAPGSPWDVVTKSETGDRVYGMRISDEQIRSLFRHHKVSVDNLPRAGEPNDESPPT